MKANERRYAIANLLLTEKKPITGAELSSRFGVSRQIIVQDIAILKGSGYDILPTHYGYIIHGSPLVERTFKVYHSTDKTEDELMLIVENGATVVDVFIIHNAYGKISAPLNISTPAQVSQFMDTIRAGKSTELMHITGGDHHHTVRAENDEILDKVEAALKAAGYIVA